MASQPKRRLTADDMLELPLPDGVIGFEFVDGQPVPVMPASFSHSDALLEVAFRLRGHIEQQGIRGRVVADAGFVLGLRHDRERMRGPDVAYVSGERLDRYGYPGERLARFVPDLAIEIDLYGPRKRGGMQRIRDYLEGGVPLVWSIDPHMRSATVFRPDGSTHELGEDGVLDGEEIVPGFRLPLADLFAAWSRGTE